MNRLPKEIFSLILSNLDMQDKLTCIRVCRRWYDIICNTNLYQKLNIAGDMERLNEAFALFYENEQFGRQVTELSLRHFYPDMFIMLTLPKLLPNVKHLKWDNWLSSKFKNGDAPPKRICDLAFKNWNKLEEAAIKMKTTDFPMVLFLLGSSEFANLTKLDIEISPAKRTFDEIYLKRRLGRELIENLKNATTLVHLRLGYAAIDFEDMELLHSNLPHLQNLELFNTNLFVSYDNRNAILSHDGNILLDNGGFGIVKTPNCKLKSISLGIQAYALPAWTTPEFQDTVRMWMTYISTKFTHIQHLAIGRSTNRYISMPLDIELFEQPLLNCFKTMKNLASVDMEVYPLTRKILKELDDNNHKLTTVTLFVDRNIYNERLEDLGSFGSKEYIKELNIIQTRAMNDSLGVNQIAFDYLLIKVCRQMPSLEALKIDSSFNVRPFTPSILFELVDLLRNLKSLYLSHLDFCSLGEEVKVLDDPCQLRSLNISLGMFAYFRCFDNASTVMDAILHSCPYLEEIVISGEIAVSSITENADLRFDFSHLKHLKKISVHIFGVSYYKLNTPGKLYHERWLDYNTPYLQEPSLHEHYFQVDLKWIPKKVSTINLSPATH
jgi:hypothetical protein